MKFKGIKPVIFLILCAIALITAVLFTSINDDKFLTKINFYFLSTGSTTIVEESREITYNEANDIIPKIIKEIDKGPLSSDKQRIIPKGVKLQGISYSEDGSSVVIDLNKKLLSEDKNQGLLAAYAVIKSVCCASSITGITHVKLTVNNEELTTADGKAIGFLTYDDITLSAEDEKIPSVPTRLYFAQGGKTVLGCEAREIKPEGGKSPEQIIIEELLNGPKSDKLKKTVYGEVLSVETRDGVCFVNFKFSFIEKNINVNPKLCIYSIVNSLTELEHIDGVQFLIDGKKVDKFGDFDISGIFRRDDTY